MQTSVIALIILVVYPSGVSAYLPEERENTHCTGCNLSPCLNGGTCVESTGTEFICTCPEGFTGDICESDICDSHDCKNEGNCVADQSVIRGYTCSCLTGYIGDNCESRVGVCDSHVCLNGGWCEADQTSARGYKCHCFQGYVGDNCEADICDGHDCKNGGNCVADQSLIRGYTCSCVTGYIGDNCEVLAIDCKVHRDIGNTESGVYSIYPFGPSSESVRTYCDMETLDGGWIAIQNRINESVSFERNWADYRVGFGGPEHSFWIGNDVIHQLTKGNDSSLYVTITLRDGRTLYELYDGFLVSTGAEKYQLYLGGPASGTLGDSMLHTEDRIFDLSGMYFSTFDKDNDRSGSNCAEFYRGGRWFNSCFNAFLNGPWSVKEWVYPWFPSVLSGEDVMETRMMVKRL